tara:strand:+ start:203 stop:529 length:327 start_codon:yes stop_codon:yes gene_type:complete
VLEYEKVADATRRAKQENPEIFAPTAPPPRPPPPPPPDLADAFTGKPLSAADDEVARRMGAEMRAEMRAGKYQAAELPKGAGGGTPMGAPAPLASKTRQSQAAEEGEY